MKLFEKVYLVVFFILLLFFIFGFYFSYAKARENIDSIIFLGEKPKENQFNRNLVYISGEIVNPGVYEFGDDMRIGELIKLAGGFTKLADSYHISSQINLSEKVENEQMIYIPTVNEQAAKSLNSNVDSSSQSNLININTADEATLGTLPGIGPSTANKIIDNRPYSVTQDLLNVSGIGQKTFDEIKDLITI